jgi:hypothetical protein
MNRIIPLNPFSNVAASGVAICDLNNLLGSTLECVNLTLGGTTFAKSNISLIQLKANGKVVFETDGSKLDTKEAYLNYATLTATILHVNFMEAKARTPNAFQAGAYNLYPDSGIVSLRLEVTIAGATAPTLTGNAELSPGAPVKGEEAIRNIMRRRHRATYTVGAAGTFALPVPHLDPAGGGSVYQRISLYSSNCTAIKAMREGVVDMDVSATDLAAIQKKAGRLPQTGLVVFDPTLDGMIAGRVWDTTRQSGVQSAQFYATFSAGETITIETEELIPFRMY